MVLRVTLSEVVVQRCSVEKVFLTISQYSKEKNQFRSPFLIKLQAFRPFKKNFLKKKLQNRCFSEYREIFKNTYFEEYMQTAASPFYLYLQ